MTDEEIYTIVADVAKRHLGGDVEVGPKTALSELAADSLSLIEIIFELEERLDIELPFNANEIAQKDRGVTIEDLVASTRAALQPTLATR